GDSVPPGMPPTEETMRIGGNRRLALAPEALWLETRGGGGAWIRTRPVAYDEIRAVYSYQVRDWGFLAAVGAIWLVLTILMLIAAAFGAATGTVTAAVILVLTVLLGALGAYRVVAAPRKLLRIDAYSGMLVVPNRDGRFYRGLADRLPTAAASDSPAAQTPNPDVGFRPPATEGEPPPVG
ncbi:MAG TPA: hypothetical protein VK689_12615, partial [Armatimonadota bacterium]|nr:hypothetical protein [Armatimonadota bacterium]